jgi:hypothetical protein
LSFADKVRSLSLKNLKKFLSFTLVNDTIIAHERTGDGTVPGEILSYKPVQVAHGTEAKQSDVPWETTSTNDDELRTELAKLEERFGDGKRRKTTSGKK